MCHISVLIYDKRRLIDDFVAIKAHLLPTVVYNDMIFLIILNFKTQFDSLIWLFLIEWRWWYLILVKDVYHYCLLTFVFEGLFCFEWSFLLKYDVSNVKFYFFFMFIVILFFNSIMLCFLELVNLFLHLLRNFEE